METYDNSIKRNHKAIKKVSLPPKKKFKKSKTESESEDFDLIDYDPNLENLKTDTLFALHTKHSNKEITKDRAPFDKG